MAYQDFKSYIADKYMDLLHREISDYVEAHHDGIGFHGHNLLSLGEQRIENIDVKSIRCVDQPDPFVKIDVNVTADIVMEGLGMSKYDADRKTKWFTIHLDVSLRNGMEIRESTAEEYNLQKFEMTTALDEYLIPYISTDMLEDEAEEFYEFYCRDAIYYEGWRLPVETILQEMEIQYYEAPLPDNVSGRMYFRKTDVDVYEYTPYMLQKVIGKKERYVVHKDIEPGTMLISHDRTFMDGIGSSFNTIAHELVHWEKHQKFFKILSLLNEDNDSLLCDVEVEQSIQKKLHSFPVPDFVWEEFWLDQEINDRGILLDLTLVENVIALDEISKDKLSDAMKDITELENPNSVAQMKQWLAVQGVETDSLGKKDVAKMIADDDIDEDVTEALRLRQQLAKSSVKKY